MNLILLLTIGLAYFSGCARAQSSNETEPPLITCPMEPTCPPVTECTCPPVTECPTAEITRSPRRRTDTGRTRTGPGRRTGQTNRTRTDDTTGPRTRSTRTRTDTGRTRTGPGRTGRTNRTRTDTARTRTRPTRTGRTNRTRTDTSETRTDTRRTRTGPRTRAERTNRTRTDTGRTRTDTRRTRTGPRTRAERTSRTRTDTGRTRTKPTDCTPRLPPGCEDFVTTRPAIFSTGTTSSPPPPLPDTTAQVTPSVTACSSSVIDVSGRREIPVVALQFYVSQSPYMFAKEAVDFAEIIALLASENDGLDTVSAAVLGISAQENGLLTVTVAVSYNVTDKTTSFQLSFQIVEAIYENLDQLGEYYQVTDMKTVRMVAQNYNSIISETHKTALSASAVATIILSMLAMTGLLGTLVILTVKFSSGLTQTSNEGQPLLNDGIGSLSTAIWSKKNDAVIF